jgi:protein involved in polysaccharide export with SLBB domain
LQRLIESRREARHGAPVTGRLRCYGAGLISRMAAYVVVAVLLVLAPDVGAQVLQEYRIGPGDRLNITIFGHNDLSGEVQVDGSGRISMPLIGQLMANSKTIMELQEEVTATLDKGAAAAQAGLCQVAGVQLTICRTIQPTTAANITTSGQIRRHDTAIT